MKVSHLLLCSDIINVFGCIIFKSSDLKHTGFVTMHLKNNCNVTINTEKAFEPKRLCFVL